MRHLRAGYISYVKNGKTLLLQQLQQHTPQLLYNNNNIFKSLIFNVTNVTASVSLAIINFLRLRYNVTLM